jgi:tRNA nucleotidyltransferase (CCA-adding enzyme)
MTTHIEIEQVVLERIKPKPEEYEKLHSTFNYVKKAILDVLSKRGLNAEVTLQGSVAHDTWLSGDRDLDVFVLFPETWSKSDLELEALQILVEAAKRVGVYELRYAEHPYVHVKVGDVEADLVPGLKLGDPSRAKTAVDRTPFHTEYVNSKLTSTMKDQVRLLKRFMKTIGVYGAEIKVKGFSGYATELLVISYGSFRGVLEAASNWKIPVFVNTIGDKFGDYRRKLRERYPDSVIYMPDPVDPLRNTTASVSIRSIATFILAATCYLRNPGFEFFEQPYEPKLERLLELLRDRCIVILEYHLREALPPDVIWGEAMRVSSRLVSVLEVLGIRAVDHGEWTNERDMVRVFIELEYCELPRYKYYRGPCIAHEWSRIKSFIERHANRGIGPWLSESGCLESLGERSLRRIVDIVESKWTEYTVSPHLRTVKPIVMTLDEDLARRLYREGAGNWLWSIIAKTPHWMEKCIS